MANIIDDNIQLIVIFSLLVLPLIAWFIAYPLLDWSITASPLEIIAVQLVLSPAFLLLGWLSYDKWGWKGLFAAFIIIFISSIIEIPHSIENPLFNSSAQMPTDPQLYFTSDAAVYSMVSGNSGQVSLVNHFISYVLIPVALGLLALFVVGIDVLSRVWKGN